MSELALFPKTHDLILWLVPRTLDFPKSQRFVLAKSIQEAALAFYEALITARKVPKQQRAQALVQADIELDKLRLFLRLSFELRLLNAGQYEHASRLVAEVGSLLGGWLKRVSTGGKGEQGSYGGETAELWGRAEQ